MVRFIQRVRAVPLMHLALLRRTEHLPQQRVIRIAPLHQVHVTTRHPQGEIFSRRQTGGQVLRGQFQLRKQLRRVGNQVGLLALPVRQLPTGRFLRYHEGLLMFHLRLCWSLFFCPARRRECSIVILMSATDNTAGRKKGPSPAGCACKPTTRRYKSFI